METNASPRYQLKAIVQNIKPSIWRRIVVPGSLTLWELHLILQVVLDWEEMHLHEFDIQKERYGDPANEESGMRKSRDEHRFRIDRVVPRKIGFRFNYTYDFGDSWQVALLVEKILPPEADSQPTCLDGSRAGPLEDSGGPPGYMELLNALRDPEHPDHSESAEWAGEDFDPEWFDLDDTNSRLRALVESGYQIEALFGSEEDDVPSLSAAQEQAFRKYLEGLTPAVFKAMDNLALRKDVAALVTYLRDHKVKGTSSAGNLPLKAIREITPLFVHPPQLDFPGMPLRTEEDVPYLIFVHLLAFQAGLLTGGPAKPWEVTDDGQVFLAIQPPAQMLQLIMNWIVNIEWPENSFTGPLDETRIPGMRREIIEMLGRLPAGKWQAFGSLGKRIAQAAGWPWSDAPDQARQRGVLSRTAYSTIIEPLAAFGALEVRKDAPEEEYQHAEIRVTPMGKSLLDVANDMLNL